MRRANFFTWLMLQVERDDDVGYLAQRVREFMKANPGHGRSIDDIRGSPTDRDGAFEQALVEWRSGEGSR